MALRPSLTCCSIVLLVRTHSPFVHLLYQNPGGLDLVSSCLPIRGGASAVGVQPRGESKRLWNMKQVPSLCGYESEFWGQFYHLKHPNRTLLLVFVKFSFPFRIQKTLLRSTLSGSEPAEWASPPGSTGRSTWLWPSPSPTCSRSPSNLIVHRKLRSKATCWQNLEYNHINWRSNRDLQGLGFGAYYLFAGMAVLASVWFTLVLPESKVLQTS